MIPFFLAILLGPGDAVLGRWEGTSTCIKAEWNASCNDEVVRYDVDRPPARGDTVTLHAFKRVNGAWEAMGDQDLGYDSTGHRWVGEFVNPRTHVLITFWLEGGVLHGRMETRPDLRKRRDMVAHRVPAP